MSRTLKVAFWATVAGQIILLLAFIAIKENTVRTGTIVLLQTVPIDPRSLLQGDFVVLDYEIAELPSSIVEARQGNRFFVELVEGQDGLWRPGLYSREKIDSVEVFIKGTVNSRGRLEFGIGTYFVPEGTGRIIERSGDVKVRVAVGSGGSAVIVELLVDGRSFDPRRPEPVLPPQDPPAPRPVEVRPGDPTPQPVKVRPGEPPPKP